MSSACQFEVRTLQHNSTGGLGPSFFDASIDFDIPPGIPINQSKKFHTTEGIFPNLGALGLEYTLIHHSKVFSSTQGILQNVGALKKVQLKSLSF